MSLTTIQPTQQIQQAPQSGIIQKLKQQQQSEKSYTIDNSGDKQKTIRTNHNSDQQYLSSSESSPITVSTIGQKVVDSVIRDDDGILKQVTASTNNNTASMMGSSNDGSNHNSVKFSPQQVLPQAFSESLEYSCEDIEREFGDLTINEQEEYKELMAETYLESVLNSRIEAILVYIWNGTQRDTKTFIDSVFNALKNPVEKPRNFELKFNPQYSLEGNLYELNRIYNKDRDVLSAKCILCEGDSKFEYKILLEQIPKYTIKALKEYFDDDDFKGYSSFISDKIRGLEKPDQGRSKSR